MRRLAVVVFALLPACEKEAPPTEPEPAVSEADSQEAEPVPIEAAAAEVTVTSPFGVGECPTAIAPGAPLVAGQDDGVAVEELKVQLPAVTESFAWPEPGADGSISTLHCGAVASFDGYTLTLAVAGGETETLAISVPEPAPFAVGDGLVVRVHLVEDPSGGHVDLLISDAEGRVRAASVESGTMDGVPGWTVLAESIESGPAVTFRHADKQTSVSGDAWRELHTPDGAYAVQGTPAAPERPTAFHVVRLHDE